MDKETTEHQTEKQDKQKEEPSTTCPACQGAGRFYSYTYGGGDPAGGPHYSPGDSYDSVEAECPHCNGKGVI